MANQSDSEEEENSRVLEDGYETLNNNFDDEEQYDESLEPNFEPKQDIALAMSREEVDVIAANLLSRMNLDWSMACTAAEPPSLNQSASTVYRDVPICEDKPVELKQKITGRRWEDKQLDTEAKQTIKSIMSKLPPPSPLVPFELSSWDHAGDSMVQELTAKGFFDHNLTKTAPHPVFKSQTKQRELVDSILDACSIRRGDTFVNFSLDFSIGDVIEGCSRLKGLRGCQVVQTHESYSEARRELSSARLCGECVIIKGNGSMLSALATVVPGYRVCLVVDTTATDLTAVKRLADDRGGVSLVSLGRPIAGWESKEYKTHNMKFYVSSSTSAQRTENESRQALEEEEDSCFLADFLGSDSDVNEFPDAWICPFLPSPQTRIRRIVSMVPITASDHVLDIGCGDGRVLVNVASQIPGAVGSGIDVDQGLVTKADVAAVDLGVSRRCRFTCGDALAKDSASGLFTIFDLESHQWAGSSPRRFSVVVIFLVHAALRKVKPLVRQIWEQGGVTVVTLGGFHFEDWPYDRADFDYDVWVINPK